jgi:putative ABC transport system permease protein
MIHDVRFALRMLARNPGVTVMATLALAIGIGGATLIFGVVNAVLLRPLSVADAERLVWIWANSPSRNLVNAFAAYSTYAEWRSGSPSFESMSAYFPGSATLVDGNDAEREDVLRVNASFFPMLGVHPLAGRNFLAEEDQPGSPAVAMLSYALWERRFASERTIVGSSIDLDGEMVRVIGILPRGFAFPIQAADIYRPIASSTVHGTARSPSVGVYGRLKPGVPIERAQAEIDAVSRRLEAAYPEMKGRGAQVWRVRDFIVRDVRLSLLILMGAVGLVLLIACANVANLLLVRASARQREIAIRTALGGARQLIFRQLLTESVMLGACGGVVGIFLADAGIRLLVRYGPQKIPFLQSVTLDGRVLLFAALTCFVTAVVFGLAPALSGLRGGIYETLKEGGAASGESRVRNRFRSALVVAEIALALLLTMSATLMMHTLLRLQSTSPGFEAEGVLTASITLPRVKYPDGAQRVMFYRTLLDRLSALPGAKAASMASVIPFSGSNTGLNLRIEGQPLPRPEETPIFWQRIIDPGYFRVMRIPLLRGREFSEQDSGSPRVAVINQTMAQRYWPGADPIGKRFGSGNDWYTVIGIVGDVKFTSLTKSSDPEYYEPYHQTPVAGMVLTIRSASAPLTLAHALRETVHEADPNLAITRVTSMEEYLSKATGIPRLSAFLLAGFGGTALLLAAIGIYGVISFSVTRRTREIGLRVALGAAQRDVIFMVLGQAVTLGSIGAALGIGGALALTRLIQEMLFEVNARDPLTYLGVSTLLIATAGVAAYLPARRAARISPSVALRSE